jgi:hypothetical protein
MQINIIFMQVWQCQKSVSELAMTEAKIGMQGWHWQGHERSEIGQTQKRASELAMTEAEIGMQGRH